MKRKILFGLGLGAFILGASQMANAGVSIGLNFALPAPVYVAPTPVYAPPPPTIVAYPSVAVVSPVVVIGRHGSQYWGGRRGWSYRDRYARGRWQGY